MSFSEFTKEDYDLIRRSYEALMPKVRKRCRDEEERPLNLPMPPTGTSGGVQAFLISYTP